LACAQAVNDELARHRPAAVEQNGAAASAPATCTATCGNAAQGTRRAAGKPRRATNSQVRAIQAIVNRQCIDLVGLLNERFSISDPAELSITQASQLIDELKCAATAKGGQQ
jgi:hypothetical protein